MTVMIAAALAALLLLSPHWTSSDHVVVVEGNVLLNSQNVFGWQTTQKHKASTSNSSRRTTSHHASSSSTASSRHASSLLSPATSLSPSSPPLKQSENIFGWQQTKSKHPTNKNYSPQRNNRRGTNKHDNPKAILNTSSSISSNNKKSEDDDRYKEDKHNLNLSPPNIKLQPRKKELWLPWPLGAMRNDFNRFVEEHDDGNNSNNSNSNNDNNAPQEWHPRNSQQQQQQQRLARNYYSEEGHHQSPSSEEEGGIFHQGRDWATRMLRRGSGMLPFNEGHQTIRERESLTQQQQPNQTAESSQSRYWIKDTTTSMATASAIPSLGKKNKKEKPKKGRNDAKSKHVMRGGESKDDNGEDDGDGIRNKNFDKDVMFRYLKLQASVRLRQLGYVGSDLSVHLPPAAPILLFYYYFPSKQDPLRRLVKYTVTGAAISWMHSEATKYRRFSPLPGMKGMNVRRPNLPPFLPEKEKWLVEDVSLDNVGGSESVGKGGRIGSTGNKGKAVSSKVKEEPKSTNKEKGESTDNPHHHWDPFQSFGTISSAYRTWLEGNNLRHKESHQQRRIRTQETLLELHASNSTTSAAAAADSNTGYALITGASSGIGRALAVELARYRIPLILVARDLTKLSAVAKDIERYYDIPCRVLSADLSEKDCAKRIHEATTSAGLEVDILVNNAGVCTHGNFIDGEETSSMDNEDAIARMVQVNINSATQLSRLYGRDMKERRRGRILFVSSMSGVLPGCPSVAVYAATKAFGKSLSMSLGREMERYGVGVTCLLPGAVKDTSFASKSDVEDAVCFHVPGYAITPELVAGVGIKGLMLGYPEIYPGWHNRAFVKMFMPMLPSRVSNIIGEWMWNPWQWGDVMPSQQRRLHPGFNSRRQVEEDDDNTKILPPLSTMPSTSASAPSALTWKFPRLSSSLPNNQTQLPDVAPQPKAGVDSSSDPTSKPTAMKIVDPVNDVLAPTDDQNTTIISEEAEPASLDMHSQQDPNNNSASGPTINPLFKSSSDTRDATLERAGENNVALVDSDKNKNDDGTATPQVADDDRSQTSIKSKEDDVKNEKGASVALVEPTPNSLVLPPPQLPKDDSQTSSSSSPLTLFGFFDKDESSSSSSHEESIHSDDTKDADTKSDKSDGMEDAKLSPDTWYPSMMEKHDYDFRDRRLDY
eukprot:CAMPEP_0201922536 /NCGR_PEP_ID=MMETSP0903-20130614/10545_1 /ASSEMBLY_ACC=CAM_ASM_000552 /TAXON_ID=420261 /ORGANISM="Thalassiosira antarctica, Strain CCMP982" /LENGTH=1160 /DNA_ID=CAMNT_0048459695 /DNA_START=49 /DNA_END=3531 /DNA_ORIENTATION=+